MQSKLINRLNFTDYRNTVYVNHHLAVDLEYNFELEGSTVIVNLKAPFNMIWDADSASASLIQSPESTSQIRVGLREAGKIVHEIVALAITNNKTDVPLRNFVKPPYNDSQIEYLKMTPDFVKQNLDSSISYFLELGTSQSEDESAIKSDYSTKLSDLQEKVTGAQIIADCSAIIVAKNMVCTNTDLTEREARILSSILIFASRVKSRLFEHFQISQEGSNDLTSFIRYFDMCVDEYYLPAKSLAPIISQEMVDHWNTESMNLDLKKVLKRTSMSLSDELRKQVGHTISITSTLLAKREIDNFSKKMGLIPNKVTNKSPFQIPYLSNQCTNVISNIRGREVVSMIWEDVLLKGLSEKLNDSIVKEHKEGKDWQKSSNRAFAKRKIHIGKEAKSLISLSGFFGKHFKQMEKNKIHREESKKSFSLDCPTNDIEKMIDDYDFWFKESITHNDGLLLRTKDLMDMAYRIANKKSINESEAYKRIESFSRTNLGQYLRVLSQLAEELNLAIQKKCEENEIIFRRIEGTDVYIIMRPTNTHLFYSIMCKTKSLLPFKEPCYSDDVNSVYIYEFVSTDKNRISSMLLCFEYACASYDTLTRFDEYIDLRMAKQKTIGTVCMMLENKQVTADIIYRLRYQYVKASSGNHFSNPLILLTKIDNLRSRFAVYVVKRICKIFTSMAELMPKKKIYEKEFEEGEDSLQISTDKYENLLDIFSGLEEPSLESAINTSYLASFHSSSTMSQRSAELKILSKVLNLEKEMRYARDSKMWKDSDYDNLLTHEFNLEISLSGSKLRRMNIERLFKEDTDRMMYEQLSFIMSKNYLDFCTYKASMVKANNEKYGPKIESRKTINNVLRLFHTLDKTINSPYEDFRGFLKMFLTEIHAKVDKKNDQPTGLREILTMDIVSRIGIRILEEFMEWTNSFSESEVLSKGTQKERIMRSFIYEVKANMKPGMKAVTFKCTLDHSKWCQMFVMTKFASGLSQLVPPKIFKLFCLILNLVTRKKIYVNKDVLDSFVKNSHVKSYDEIIVELRSQFLGDSESNDLIDKWGAFIKNRSNMGQGWLHNTSGGDGDADVMLVQLTMKFIITTYINNGRLPKETRFISNAIDSSDDQAYQFALIVPEGWEDKVLSLITLLSFAPMKVSSLSNKKMGPEKSEYFHLQDFVEFNQLNQSGNNQFVGKVKFDKASLEIPVTLNIQDRFSNFANTRRNVLENGSDLIHVNMIMMLQSIIHYRSLGALIDPLFKEYSNLLKEKPHANLGFFYYEKEQICGIFGHDMAKYISVKNDIESAKVAKFFLKRNDLAMGLNGDKGPMINFKVVKTESFKAFQKGVKMDEVMFAEKPQILYLGPENRKEMENVIKAKILDPNAELSFTYESTPKMMQASILFLRQPVLKYSRGMDAAGKRMFSSCNIFYFLDIVKKNEEPISDEEMKILFPRSDLYDLVIDNLSEVNDLTYIRKDRISKSKVSISLDTLYPLPKISLLDCVKEVWFGKKTKHSSTLIRINFSRYKEMFPWLEDTHDETLRNNLNLFENVFELHSTVVSQETKYNNPKIVCPVKVNHPIKMLRNFLIYNWNDNCKGFTMSEEKPLKLPSIEKFCKDACLFLSGPFSRSTKFEKISTIPIMSLKDFSQEKVKLYRNLSLVSQIINEDSKDFVEKLSITKEGFVSWFAHPQKKVEEKWVGDSIYCMIIEGCQFKIFMQKGEMTIESKTKTELSIYRKTIFKEIVRLGWTDSLKDSGPRITEYGLETKKGKYGIQFRIDHFMHLEFSLSIDELDLVFIGTNKIQIKSKFERSNPTILSIIIESKDVSFLETYEEIRGLESKWMYDEKLSLYELQDIILNSSDSVLKWVKDAFKYKMDTRTMSLPFQDLQNKEDAEISTPLSFGQEIVDLGLGINFDDEEIDIMIGEMKQEGEPEIEDILPDIGIFSELEAVDILFGSNTLEKTNFRSPIEKSKIFDELIDNLLYINIDSLYSNNLRMLVAENDPYFKVFKELVDYDQRPLALTNYINEAKKKKLPEGFYVFGKRQEDIVRPKIIQELTQMGIQWHINPLSIDHIPGFYWNVEGRLKAIEIQSWRKQEEENELRSKLAELIANRQSPVAGRKVTFLHGVTEMEHSKKQSKLISKVKKQGIKYDKRRQTFSVGLKRKFRSKFLEKTMTGTINKTTGEFSEENPLWTGSDDNSTDSSE